MIDVLFWTVWTLFAVWWVLLGCTPLGDHRWFKWLTNWRVTFGIAIHHNLLPEFIWEWEQLTPPPWKKLR